jgi:SAM-dependent methyltransferase
MTPITASTPIKSSAGNIWTRTPSAVFEIGEWQISDLMAWLKQNGINCARGRAIDFGCGVGRLTLPLSHIFESVVAIDISPDMLAETMINAKANGRDRNCDGGRIGERDLGAAIAKRQRVGRSGLISDFSNDVGESLCPEIGHDVLSRKAVRGDILCRARREDRSDSRSKSDQGREKFAHRVFAELVENADATNAI